MADDTDDQPVTVEAMRKAVAQGIHDAVSNPELWAAAVAAMQAKAKTEAGGWLIGSVKAAISKLAWLLMIGLGVYLIGGWTALVSLFKAGAHGS
jgi:hypothetical protein